MMDNFDKIQKLSAQIQKEQEIINRMALPLAVQKNVIWNAQFSHGNHEWIKQTAMMAHLQSSSLIPAHLETLAKMATDFRYISMSPAVKAITQNITAMNSAVSPVAKAVIAHLDSMRTAISPMRVALAKQVAEIQKFTSPAILSLAESVKTAQELFKPSASMLAVIDTINHQRTLFESLSTLSDASLETYRQSILAEMDSVEDQLQIMEEQVDIEENVLVSRYEYKRVLHLLYNLFMFYFAVIFPILSDKSTTENIYQLRAETFRSFAELSSQIVESNQPTEEVSVITAKMLNVRSKPVANSLILEKLYYNQDVVILDTKQKWVQVEWYDGVEDITKYGWVMKKWMKKYSGRTHR